VWKTPPGALQAPPASCDATIHGIPPRT